MALRLSADRLYDVGELRPASYRHGESGTLLEVYRTKIKGTFFGMLAVVSTCSITV